MKMHRGTIVMWRVSIVSVVVMLLLVYSAIVFSSPSKQYWESVGPKWDQMLNPCKYKECIVTQ